ncbi:MAG: transcriptional regulator, family with cupin sensor domain [Rhizobacter sp.]|jgi:transcriptional regulator with XRE-family HTH domain|nr:transcriptional regulator, family with cupin sensor domain [Rhizobacter sp.]
MATAAKTKKPGKAKAAEAAPQGWRRPAVDQSVTQELGVRIRALREARGLSLAQLGEKCGVPGATLSRIENNKLSPTFGVLARVMMGLEVDWVDLTAPKAAEPGDRLVSFAEPGDGAERKVRESTASVLHSHESARSLPLLIDVRTRDLAESGGLIGHRGEEFCYVLSGKLVLHLEGRPPRVMKAGASALFDSATPHAYLAADAVGAKILVVVQRQFGMLPQEGDDAPAT